MSDYHILVQEVQNGHRRAAQVAFHVPVPAAGTNEAGISWREVEQNCSGEFRYFIQELFFLRRPYKQSV